MDSREPDIASRRHALRARARAARRALDEDERARAAEALAAHLLERPELAGPVNFVAPDPATNAEFTHALAAAVGRRSYLRIPSFAAKLAPGGMAEEMLLGGAALVPRRLLESGYTFRWPELRPALAAMFRA